MGYPRATVRSMSSADLLDVMLIERRSFSVPWEEPTFRGLMRRPSVALLVAELDDRVAGYSVTWFTDDAAELGDIAVLPELRGRGIGSLLLRESITLAAGRGARFLHLEVRHGNEVARRLYEKAGFDVAGVRKEYYTEPVEDAIVMRLDLHDTVR